MTALTYDDLKLGEKAKDAFFEGKDTEYIVKTCPVYLNTRPFFAGLNCTDAVTAAVLAGLNIMLVGDTGCGKSQLASDINSYYFGGNKSDGGQGIWVKGRPDLDVNTEIFTQLNMGQGKWELTDRIESLLYVVDEINRCPPIAQNQFFGMGDGKMDFNGNAKRLGREGYAVLIATANLGNGEFSGTFESDKALYNRLHVAMDFDHVAYRPTNEDQMMLDMMRASDPRIKEAPKRDISELILKAKAEIDNLAKDPGMEALAVAKYLQFGLDNCVAKKGSKGKTWPMQCQECDQNKAGDALCSYVRAPVRRTIESTLKYAAALYYMAGLKNPNVHMNSADLMFKAFEVTGAYQQILNPSVLKMKYADQNPKLMAEVADKLKADYKANEDYIVGTIDAIKDGRKAARFFKDNENVGDYDALNSTARKAVKPNAVITPYTDGRMVGLGWMNEFIDLNLKLIRLRAKK